MLAQGGQGFLRLKEALELTIMKKLHHKHKLRIERHSERELFKRIAFNSARKKDRKAKKGFEVVRAPEVFDLQSVDHRVALIDFSKLVRSKVANGETKIWVDFSNTRSLSPEGMIFIYAELSRLSELASDLIIRSTPPKDKVVGQVFNKLKFSKVVKAKIKPSRELRRNDVAPWRSAHGQGVVGEKCKSILEEYDGIIAPSLSKELFNGMTEAMTNAHHHAYIDERGDDFTHADFYKPWWLFSHEHEGELSVIFCDLGMGIPKTLPIVKPNLFNRIISVFGPEVKDSAAIDEAVKDSVTRTHLSHRGKGLRQIVETISNSNDGQMSIMSNRGCYTVGKDGNVTLKDYDTSILGTIVKWRMKLPDSSALQEAA